MICHDLIKTEELQFQQARSQTYLLLANAFLGNWLELKEAAAKVTGQTGDGAIDLLVAKIAKTPMRELKIQYDNLFVVPGSYFVPPIASYHLNLEDDELNNFLENLYLTYMAFNYHLPFERYERGDHIGYMLLFVHFASETINNNKNEDQQLLVEMQMSFIKNNLNSWLTDFEKQVEKKLEKGLLLDVVRYTTKFIKWDAAQPES